MSESITTVKAANWRLVEVGRVVLIKKGTYSGKLAVIVEIIDHKRVLVDGPATEVPRQALSLAHVVLTPLTVPNVTRGARSVIIAKKWAASDVSKKWAASSWAKKIAQRERRSQLTDFERFQVGVFKKQKKYALNKALAKA